MGKSPEKNCPKCKTSLHVRKRECPCGYEFPKTRKKRKRKKGDKEVTEDEVTVLFDGWKPVPPRSRKLTCGLCRKKMTNGMLGWFASFSDGDKYWWCERCIKDDNDVSKVATVCKDN